MYFPLAEDNYIGLEQSCTLEKGRKQDNSATSVGKMICPQYATGAQEIQQQYSANNPK